MDLELTKEACTAAMRAERLSAALQGFPPCYSKSPFLMAVGLRLCEVVDAIFGGGDDEFMAAMTGAVVQYDEEKDVFLFSHRVQSKSGNKTPVPVPALSTVEIPRSWLWLPASQLKLAWERSHIMPAEPVNAV